MITRRQQLKRLLKWILILFIIHQVLTTLFHLLYGKDLLEECLVDKDSFLLEEKLKCLRYHRCPHRGEPYTNTSRLILCNKDVSSSATLLLMTTMYAKENMFIFNNTLHIWRSLGPRVHPIIFIDSVEGFLQQQKTGFLKNACNMGWTVAMAPLCNEHQFPVFKQLFVATMSQWNATWYGYANGDMLFDDSLLDSLDFLTKHKPIYETSMVVGRRYHLKLKVNQSVHKSEIASKFSETRMADSAMVDYFLTMEHAFPWQDIPDFVIGRPGYDTWLVWLINAMKLQAVDTTTSIRAVHQVIDGLSEDENSHKTHKQEAGMLYNEDLAKRLSITRNLQLVRGLGYLSCVNHKLAKIRKSLLKKMVAEAKGPLIEVIGRGQDVLPIKAFEALMERNNTSKKEVNQSQKISNQKPGTNSFNNNTNTSEKSPHKRRLLTVNDTRPIHSERMLKGKRGKKRVKRIHPVNQDQPSDLQLESKHDSKKDITKPKKKDQIEEPNWYALNTKTPVSFIPDSPEFQYVLIKRTKYYRHLANNNGFRQVFQNLHGACYHNQHIDLEVGDLIIY